MLSKVTSMIGPYISDLSWPQIAVSDLIGYSVLLAFIGLVALEKHVSRGRRDQTLRQSYRTNLITFLFNDTLMSLLSVSALLLVAEKYGGPGLLGELSDTAWGVILTFILFDLTLYLWHWANHNWDGLWMFHKVHHSDRRMNTSTAFRLHFIEVLLTTLVKAIFIMVLGVKATVVLASEAIITLFVLFHHTDVAFRGERLLGKLIVVPYLHRAHHSALRAEHDHNYGALFSVWDRLFGTLIEVEPEEIGLQGVKGQDFLELLRYGFTRAVAMPTAECLRRMIAEAAYYRAETRGFMPGWELADWLAAEREIKKRVSV